MEMDSDPYENVLKELPFSCGKDKLKQKYVYEIEIGRGAYGCVMCGYRQNDHCSVAIKAIPNDSITNWYYSERLQMNVPMEIILLALTSHIEGVISIIEYNVDPYESMWYIVMERFSKAIDLFEFISSRDFLTESLACYIFYQLTLTVIDCHLCGVLHRDIKEENILIDTNSKKVWLIDFGSGGIMNDDNHYVYNGTLEYAAPEWIKCGHYRGCQLESWSLGIVLYSMVCGSIPFDEEEQILTSDVRFPRNISENCKDIILKCLERDPELRIHPFEIMTHPWIKSTLNNYDSGHGSFDESYLESNKERRRCSCSCADNALLFTKEENTHCKAAIESVDYDSECIKEIDSDWRFKIFSKSLSPDLKRKDHLILSPNLPRSKKDENSNKSVSVMNLSSQNSRKLDDKYEILNKLLTEKDYGYEEDMDDDFQYDEESITLSNDIFPLEI